MGQYICGKNTIKQFLNDKRNFQKMFIMKNSQNDEIVNLCQQKGITVIYKDKKEMDSLLPQKHQGCIGLVDDFKIYSLDEILESSNRKEYPLVLILDGMEDPHNLGAILRTCDAVGVDGVIIRKNRSVTLNATVAKVSCGAIDTVKVAEVNNLTDTIKKLKKAGFWVCGAENIEALDYREPDYKVKLALVIGSEGFGISRLVRENLDYCVKLPMEGTISSLNASVATGIMLYEIYNQRSPLSK